MDWSEFLRDYRPETYYPPRIEHDPEIMDGKPFIRNTSILVDTILEQLAAGRRVDDVLNAYPILIPEDLQAVMLYAMANGEWEKWRERFK